MARYSERWSYVESAWNPDDDICLHRVDIARFAESGHEQCRRPCIQFFFIVAMVVKVVDTIDQCRSWTDQCLSRSQLSMDVEGVDLCRSGPISIIQIGLDSDVLLFDIITLGQDAFSRGGLKDLLESERVCKVIYDGRLGWVTNRMGVASKNKKSTSFKRGTTYKGSPLGPSKGQGQVDLFKQKLALSQHGTRLPFDFTSKP